jgi:CubicO group peptidase (beta-lactamase class C family)
MVRRGQLVAEHYAPGYGRDSVLTSFSIAKSVVSALVGIAKAEGRLSVTDPVTRWLPELRGNDARFEQVRLIDLLRMRSGIRFDESYSAPNSEAARFCCLNARAVDFARFGMLFLNEGRAGSHQVVPADWVRTSSAAQQALPGADDAARRNVEWRGQGRRSAFYALQWRRAPAAAPASTSAPAPDSAQALPGTDFYAQGLHGQFVYVAPQSDTVVLRFGRSAGEVFWPAWLGEWARLNP